MPASPGRGRRLPGNGRTARQLERRIQVEGVRPARGHGDRLVGMITDRDVTVRATAVGVDPGATKVRDVMTPDVVYAFEDQEVGEAAKLMEGHQVRRLVVLDRDKRLVGIVSLGDLAEDTGDDTLTGQVLEGVSEPSEPNR